MDMEKLGQRVEVPHHDECGPAMRALTENQRRYVAALGVFGNNQTWAYQWAYGSDNPRAAQASSSRLAVQDKIKTAINEHYLDKRTQIMPAMITDALLELMGPTNTDDKARLKAIQTAVELVPGMKAAVQMELTVKHKLSLPELEAKARRLQEQLKLPQLPEQEVIDVDFSEVSSEGIEDLL